MARPESEDSQSLILGVWRAWVLGCGVRDDPKEVARIRRVGGRGREEIAGTRSTERDVTAGLQSRTARV